MLAQTISAPDKYITFVFFFKHKNGFLRSRRIISRIEKYIKVRYIKYPFDFGP